MKAIAIRQPLPLSHPDCFEEVELPDPQPGPGDLLVRVRATAVNPIDFKIRQRRDPAATEPTVLGWDGAGVVEAIGSEVTLFEPGDEIMFTSEVTRQGSNAEHCLVRECMAGRKPKTLDFEGSAALPLTGITAWEGLFDSLALSENGDDSGRSILIIGGAGGMGSISIQLAKKIGKLRVIATASRPETEASCRSLGADEVINHRKALAPQLAALGIPEVDYIFCLHDTSGHWNDMAAVIRPRGSICCLVDAAGPIDLNLFKPKSVRICWEFMSTRPLFQCPDLIEHHRILGRIAQGIDSGLLTSTHRETLGPLTPENLTEAHRRLESGQAIGKIVLRVP